MSAPTDVAVEGTALQAAEPQLYVEDMAAALAFYTGALGFGLRFTYGEPAFYAQVESGGARLNLRHAEAPIFDAGFRGREPDALSATLVLEDASALFAQFREAGVAFHRPLTEEPWGARTFIVADPSGNLVCFAGRT